MRPNRGKVTGGKITRFTDMSLPPDERRRKQKGTRKTRKSVPAQMDHGAGRKADRLRKTGEAKLRRRRRGK